MHSHVRALLVAVTWLGSSSLLNAQRIEPAGAVALRSASANPSQTSLYATTDSVPAATLSRTRAIAVRATIGAAGSVVGVFAGAFTLGAVLPRTRCQCDDDGFAGAIEGAMVGSLVASALVAAIPRLDRTCGYGKRVGYGLLAGVPGAVVGGLAGAVLGGGGGGVVLGYVLGAGLGASVGSEFC